MYNTKSGHLRSPMGRQSQLGGAAGNYIITTEPWCVNSIDDQFTTRATVDKIINANTSKVPWKDKG